MIDTDISALLKKADELKALFILGQRVIPFLEEIFFFVNDIKPMLDEINTSIEDNLKKMPNASKQLSKVTEATEMATNEIMDIVDGLVYKSDIIANNLKRITEYNAKKEASPVKILEIINMAVKNDASIDDLMPQLTSAIDEMRGIPAPEYNELVDGTNELLQSIQSDSSSIMMSLQVQDITSQQIAAVNHLLETIQKKLNSILSKFQSSELSELIKVPEKKQRERYNISTLHRTIAFDPDAVESISAKESRQSEVDAMIQKAEEDIDLSQASPDDIDALFNGGFTEDVDLDTSSQNENITKVNSAEDENIKEEEFGDEQVSQDDIDALFG